MRIQIARVAIKYTVDVYKVEGGTETKVDSACKPVATLELPTEPEKKNTASISINELTTSGTYKVVVNSTAPYTKMLSANFVITAAQTPSEAVSFTVNDQENSPVLYLNISVGNYSGALNLTLPAGIYPDPTDDKYEELKTNTITVEKYSSYRFVYFKDDISVKHDASAFEVEPVEP